MLFPPLYHLHPVSFLMSLPIPYHMGYTCIRIDMICSFWLLPQLKGAATKVADTISDAPTKAVSRLSDVGSGSGTVKTDNDFNTFRNKQAEQADAVGKDAREKSEKVFSDLKRTLKGQ